MSIRLMNLAWQAGITSTQKLVLIALADWCNDAGICWPSISTLARKTSLSERGLRKVLRNLEEAGLLETEIKPGKGNLYQLKLDPGTECRGGGNEVPDTPERDSSNTFIDTPKTQLPTAKQSKRTLLPSDWTVAEGEINWALFKFPSLNRSDLENETDRFRDYWAAEGKLKADWQATWRNWIRRSVQYAKAKRIRSADRTSDNYNRLREALDADSIQAPNYGLSDQSKYLSRPD